MTKEETELNLRREKVYGALLVSFGTFADQVGGWTSENGVYLDGKLWALAKQIVEGEFNAKT